LEIILIVLPMTATVLVVKVQQLHLFMTHSMKITTAVMRKISIELVTTIIQ